MRESLPGSCNPVSRSRLPRQSPISRGVPSRDAVRLSSAQSSRSKPRQPPPAIQRPAHDVVAHHPGSHPRVNAPDARRPPQERVIFHEPIRVLCDGSGLRPVHKLRNLVSRFPKIVGPRHRLGVSERRTKYQCDKKFHHETPHFYQRQQSRKLCRTFAQSCVTTPTVLSETVTVFLSSNVVLCATTSVKYIP